MLEPPVKQEYQAFKGKPLRLECGDIRVINLSYGQSANDKASATRFNDWKGVDSAKSLRYSLFPIERLLEVEIIRDFKAETLTRRGNASD